MEGGDGDKRPVYTYCICVGSTQELLLGFECIDLLVVVRDFI